jgi:hypothetical protein
VPAAFGRRDGVVVEYLDRVAQLGVVQHDAGGAEFLAELMDLRTEGGRIVWGLTLPSRVLYDVTPFCRVRFCWLLLRNPLSP